MARIEPKDWWKERYASAAALCDVLRAPTPGYESLPPEEKDRLRQTQIEPGETVRLLGESAAHYLIQKRDGVLGWVPTQALAATTNAADGARAFAPAPPAAPLLREPLEFCESWKGTRYLWGGVTRAGVDCSAFTQRYYLEALGRQIPRNSHEQRRAGRAKALDQIADHDLVFCHRKGGRGVHHVGVFYRGGIWHARLDLGVVREDLADFLATYDVLEVVAYGD